MGDELKLYRVTLRGMTYATTGVAYGIPYVVAVNLEEAYKKVKKFLDENDLGYSYEREIDKIELLATTYQYNKTGIMLFI